jgi:hypothetical protein
MVDMRGSQAAPGGAAFGYLGVRISGAEVWTTGHGSPSRYLGPLEGARAGVTEPSRSRIGMFISRLLLGQAVPKNARLFVAFPDNTRYERQLVPWDLRADWPKIAGEIGRFNSAAYLS